MTETLPPCPECASEFTYESGALLACPMCAHEWAEEEVEPVRDAVGNVLSDGDSVSVVKSLKIKGGGAMKIGTRVTGIRLLEFPVDGHDIEAKIPGVGQLRLRSSVVKKLG